MSKMHTGLWYDVDLTYKSVNASSSDIWSFQAEDEISKAAKGEPYDYFLTVGGRHIPMIGDHGHGYPLGGPQDIQAGLRRKTAGHLQGGIHRAGKSNQHHVHVNGQSIGTIHHVPGNEKHKQFVAHGKHFAKMGDAAKHLHEQHFQKQMQHHASKHDRHTESSKDEKHKQSFMHASPSEDSDTRQSGNQHHVYAGDEKIGTIRHIPGNREGGQWVVNGKKFGSKEDVARYVHSSHVKTKSSNHSSKKR